MSDLVDLLPVILVALVLWLSGLSFAFYKLLAHYRRIAKKSGGGDLLKAIDALFAQEEKNSAEVKNLKAELNKAVKRSVLPIQKFGLVRFNPFDEIGGDQSFSLCLLDGTDSGFILTALHTRDRTRVYTKPIQNGKSKYELSAEEKKSLAAAQKIK